MRISAQVYSDARRFQRRSDTEIQANGLSLVHHQPLHVRRRVTVEIVLTISP